MKKTALYIITALLMLVAVQSCSTDSDYEGSAGKDMRKRVLMDLSLSQFSEAASRAGASFSNGAKVYIDFGGVKGTAVYDGSQWTIEYPDELAETTSGTCRVAYVVNPSSESSSSVGLLSSSVVYEATGTYKNTVDEMSVTATLSPSTSRVHFRGKSGTSITVKGLKCNKQFSISNFTFSISNDDITLSVKSDGYTDYVYCLFASSTNDLAIVNDGSTYTRRFASNVLQAGHSGYIDIPTADSFSGWETDSRSYINISGNDYDGDSNCNQPDPEQNKNTNISGNDYNSDGNWNQPDPEQNKNTNISGNDYNSDGNWNQPDPEQNKNTNISGNDYNGDGDWNQKDPDPENNLNAPVNGYDNDENWNATVHNGHEYVDLGLSVKWATMNVGALKPEGYGHYFAWGEIYSKTEYNWATYKDNPSHDGKTFTKYALDKKTVLDPEDDVAHVKWGGSWRMPTEAEQDELREKCTWTWTTQNGVNGRMVTGPNGNSIFLPAAGDRYYSRLDYAGSYGRYWSSSLYVSSSNLAPGLYFDLSNVNCTNYSRFYGLSVRPVCP